MSPGHAHTYTHNHHTQCLIISVVTRGHDRGDRGAVQTLSIPMFLTLSWGLRAGLGQPWGANWAKSRNAQRVHGLLHLLVLPCFHRTCRQSPAPYKYGYLPWCPSSRLCAPPQCFSDPPHQSPPVLCLLLSLLGSLSLHYGIITVLWDPIARMHCRCLRFPRGPAAQPWATLQCPLKGPHPPGGSAQSGDAVWAIRPLSELEQVLPVLNSAPRLRTNYLWGR